MHHLLYIFDKMGAWVVFFLFFRHLSNSDLSVSNFTSDFSFLTMFISSTAPLSSIPYTLEHY